MEGTKYRIVDELEIHIGSIATLHKKYTHLFFTIPLLYTSKKN